VLLISKQIFKLNIGFNQILKIRLMKKNYTILLSLLFAFVFAKNASSQEVVDATTLNNKIMAGYQGWFAADGDGSNEGWIHWAGGRTEIPDANNITIDFWPDLREYEKDELFATNFTYKDGSNAGLYSAYTPKTVERHVKWMKDYGIDGVFVQRFINSAVSIKALRDQVLQNVRYASEKHGRVFANMYDISGGNPDILFETITKDWMHLVDDLKILESPNYIHHNGLPVLSIWGFGLRDEFTPELANRIIDWFTIDAPAKYRVSLKGGIDDKWQTHSTAWIEVYKRFDVLSPWSVGRYSNNSGADSFRDSKIKPDLITTESFGIDYMPVVFPGFSWSNLKDGSPLNQIPRNGGNFLWRQFYNAVNVGCNMVYVAMFDEVDEGTAIYKLAENNDQLPTTGAFVPLNADGIDLPSDWYLRLTGEATKMLRGIIPITATIPITPTLSDAKFISQEVSTIMSPNESSTVHITFQNTGKTSWTKAQGFKLGSQNVQDNTIWGLKRVELDEGETIAPGGSKTFTFDVTAPSQVNTYNFQWRMMQEGVNWFGQSTVNKLVNVLSDVKMLDDCDVLTDWTSLISLALNNTDKKQGTNCIEFVGGLDHTIEFEKVFSVPFNSGIFESDAVLQFWYYVSDASKLEALNKVELGSSGNGTENLYRWSLGSMSTGWNLISLDVKQAVKIGTPDLNAINWFYLERKKTAEIKTRIDEIQVLDKNSTAEKFSLVVKNGKGSGSYIVNSIVEIVANEAPAGQKFKQWVVTSGNPSVLNLKASKTNLITTNTVSEVTASYEFSLNYLDDCDDITGWKDASRLTYKTDPKQQGLGCIEFNGTATAEFAKVFSTAFNSGVTRENGVLEFWYYISDALLIGSSNQIEIGSAGRSDVDEYNWSLAAQNLTTGWNLIRVNTAQAGVMGAPDLSAINWFRLYNAKTATVTTRIDAIKITSTENLNKLTLIVGEGSGSGLYEKNEAVTITANEPAVDMIFDKWRINSGTATLANPNDKTTVLTLASDDVSVSATYKEIYNGMNDDFMAKYSVNIYPNPLKGNLLSIDLRGFEGNDDINIMISNLLGQTVYTYSTQNTGKIEIDTNGLLDKSIYIITVKSGKLKVSTKLIVD